GWIPEGRLTLEIRAAPWESPPGGVRQRFSAHTFDHPRGQDTSEPCRVEANPGMPPERLVEGPHAADVRLDGLRSQLQVPLEHAYALLRTRGEHLLRATATRGLQLPHQLGGVPITPRQCRREGQHSGPVTPSAQRARHPTSSVPGMADTPPRGVSTASPHYLSLPSYTVPDAARGLFS